ncbi:myosin heavy chain, cardiac muscle isoform [Cinnamomum micranthum f. kanehirae]|uniref:Myosin heavy chain, cardiac muscle isoform n=1 Tax=Cinnamomum micranthum f. kanehirae TaxID=337451 RepID=A0A443PUH3_9MAGN|nr:myosin heavy chain, cardiac muscle isoform [Cinnamomum micranthum f. kanehirae]
MSKSEKVSSSVGEVDPLLKDLREKKLNFQRNVIALVSELEEVRGQLALQEESLATETQNRKVAEMKVRRMEDEICQLQKSLEERNEQVQESASIAKQYLNELDKLRPQLSLTQATSEASATSTHYVKAQCLDLLISLDEKIRFLEEHENQVNRLTEKLDLLQMDLQVKEVSQIQLKDEVLRIGHEIMHEIMKSGANHDYELKKIFEMIFSKNFEKVNKQLSTMVEEIATLRDEIKDMTDCWITRTKELELELGRHQKSEKELKKRVLKLEFCLQEAHIQMWKLQRMGERGDKALMELRDQLADKQESGGEGLYKQNFWEGPSFKIAISVSVLVLVVFLRW